MCHLCLGLFSPSDVNKVFRDLYHFVVVLFALSAINDALDSRDSNALICAMKMPYCRLREVTDGNASQYMAELLSARQLKSTVSLALLLDKPNELF